MEVLDGLRELAAGFRLPAHSVLWHDGVFVGHDILRYGPVFQGLHVMRLLRVSHCILHRLGIVAWVLDGIQRTFPIVQLRKVALSNEGLPKCPPTIGQIPHVPGDNRRWSEREA